MIPKTEIRYSWIYNLLFNDKLSKKDILKLKENCKEFEGGFQKFSEFFALM